MIILVELKETLNNHQSGSWLQSLLFHMKVYFVVQDSISSRTTYSKEWTHDSKSHMISEKTQYLGSSWGFAVFPVVYFWGFLKNIKYIYERMLILYHVFIKSIVGILSK